MTRVGSQRHKKKWLVVWFWFSVAWSRPIYKYVKDMAEPCTLFYFKHPCVGYGCFSWVFCRSLIHFSGSLLIAYTARLDMMGVKCIHSLPGNVTISRRINGA